MGICSSTSSTHVATAKLILHDGRLEEFPYPVKVSYLLSKNPSTFICNSDDMDFDGVVTAVAADEELLPGQLYFALPLTRLRQRLLPEDMAALAVKASSALGGAAAEKCGCRRSSVSPASGTGDVVKTASNGGGGRRRGRGRGRFEARLSAIPE